MVECVLLVCKPGRRQNQPPGGRRDTRRLYWAFVDLTIGG